MRKAFVLVLAMVLSAFIAEAQPGGQGRQFSPEDMAKRQTDQMAEYVKMTKEVQAKVYDLNLKYAKKSQELRSGGNFQSMSDAQREKMRSQMNAQQQEKDQEMKKLLTAEQFKQYEKYREEARQRMQQRRP